jgi:competence protein ComEC
MKITKYLLGLLLLAAVSVWAILLQGTDEYLHIVACDVGQGDAILIYKENTQILIDGGPNDKVLSCLSKHVPPDDGTIELVVLTHAQKDHYGGLLEVFKRYKVTSFMESGLGSSSQDYKALEYAVGSGGTKVVEPAMGQGLGLGMIYLDIYNPSEKNLASSVLGANTENIDLNDYSVTFKLTYGSFDAFFPGDLSPEKGIDISKVGNLTDVEYIKVPHHGSINGLTKELLNALVPEIAVISVGKNNSYGHPSDIIIKMLNDAGARIFRTDLDGEVEIITDGSKWWVQGEKNVNII